jgi:hypothetical protein
MTCKYLTKTMKAWSQETGSSIHPQMREEPICAKGRQQTTVFWASRCEKTPEEGPCWWWIDEHGDTPDPAF